MSRARCPVGMSPWTAPAAQSLLHFSGPWSEWSRPSSAASAWPSKLALWDQLDQLDQLNQTIGPKNDFECCNYRRCDIMLDGVLEHMWENCILKMDSCVCRNVCLFFFQISCFLMLLAWIPQNSVAMSDARRVKGFGWHAEWIQLWDGRPLFPHVWPTI